MNTNTDRIRLSGRLELRRQGVFGNYDLIRDGIATGWLLPKVTADALIEACNQRELNKLERCLIAAETRDLDHLDDMDAANVDPQSRRLREIIQRRRAELIQLNAAPLSRLILPPGVIHGSDGKFYAPGAVVRTLPDGMWERRKAHHGDLGLWFANPNDDAAESCWYEVRPTAANPLPTLPDTCWQIPDGRICCLRKDAQALRDQGATIHYTDESSVVDSWADPRYPSHLVEVRFPAKPATETIDTRLAKGRKMPDGTVIYATGDDRPGPWFRSGSTHGARYGSTVEVLVEGDAS